MSVDDGVRLDWLSRAGKYALVICARTWYSEITSLLQHHGVRISMDGKGSYNDNLFIERLWWSVKYEEVYLKAFQDGTEARIGPDNYFHFYNSERPHQALGYRTPTQVFTLNPGRSHQYRRLVESLTPDPSRIAIPDLNITPILS